MIDLAFPLQNWIPYKLQIGESVLCHWIDSQTTPFCEPFFHETIQKLKGLPRRKVRFDPVSSLEMAQEWAADLTCVEQPTAFIFHISRCGSTLLAQMLDTQPDNIVLAEVPYFDDLLRLPYKKLGVSTTYVDELLKAGIRFYGQKRLGIEQNLYIKTDSWHICFYEQLRALYPGTPFVLLYRSPNEVWNSHTRQRGMHAVPGIIEPEVFGFHERTTSPANADSYLADVLSVYLRKYIQIAAQDANTLLLNYNEGIMPMMNKIADFTGVPLGEEQYAKMEARAGYHSKYPGRVFAEEQFRAIPQFLGEAHRLYLQLEEIRTKG